MLAFLLWIGRLLQRFPRGFGGLMVVVWTLGTARMSSWPGTDEVGPFLQSWIWDFGHAPLFGMLAVWMILALPRRAGWPELDPASCLRVLAAVAICGALDEFHQGFTPGRDVSIFDFATDLVGAGCVLWIAAYLARASATEAGLWKRLVLGLFFCALVSGASTLSNRQPRKTPGQDFSAEPTKVPWVP